MTVDGGQAFGPVPAEAFRAFVGQLLFLGMSPEEVKIMAQTVPARGCWASNKAYYEGDSEGPG